MQHETSPGWHELMHAAMRQPSVARCLEADRAGTLRRLADIWHCTNLLQPLAAGGVSFEVAQIEADCAVAAYLHQFLEDHLAPLSEVLARRCSATTANQRIARELGQDQAGVKYGRWHVLRTLSELTDWSAMVALTEIGRWRRGEVPLELAAQTLLYVYYAPR